MARFIDASLVAVPIQRKGRDENKQIKGGEVPEAWKPAKRRQKDRGARWTKKHGTRHYGRKNHVSIDRRHKLIRCYRVTDARTRVRIGLKKLAYNMRCLVQLQRLARVS